MKNEDEISKINSKSEIENNNKTKQGKCYRLF